MDKTAYFVDSIKQACSESKPLRILGGGSKACWYPNAPDDAQVISSAEHSGILSYEPSELVMRVRSGTLLLEVLSALSEHKQIFSFEPSIFSEKTTIGGVVAAGWAGPNRPWGGAVRDSLLGVELINAQGDVLRFGGQVFKNVAGFDLFRVQAGGHGQFGMLTTLSLRLNPEPKRQCHKKIAVDRAQAQRWMNDWQVKPYPLSGLSYAEGYLHLRLFGQQGDIAECLQDIGLDWEEGVAEYWYSLRDLRHAFFAQQKQLFALYLPPAAYFEVQEGEQVLIDWGGALVWLCSDASLAHVAQRAELLGGQAQPYPLHFNQHIDAAHRALHKRLKTAFDPDGLFV